MRWQVEQCQQSLVEIGGALGVLDAVFLLEEVLEVDTLFAGTRSLCICLYAVQQQAKNVDGSIELREVYLLAPPDEVHMRCALSASVSPPHLRTSFLDVPSLAGWPTLVELIRVSDGLGI
jgi:hypothetical protein